MGYNTHADSRFIFSTWKSTYMFTLVFVQKVRVRGREKGEGSGGGANVNMVKVYGICVWKCNNKIHMRIT